MLVGIWPLPALGTNEILSAFLEHCGGTSQLLFYKNERFHCHCCSIRTESQGRAWNLLPSAVCLHQPSHKNKEIFEGNHPGDPAADVKKKKSSNNSVVFRKTGVTHIFVEGGRESEDGPEQRTDDEFKQRACGDLSHGCICPGKLTWTIQRTC